MDIIESRPGNEYKSILHLRKRWHLTRRCRMIQEEDISGWQGFRRVSRRRGAKSAWDKYLSQRLVSLYWCIWKNVQITNLKNLKGTYEVVGKRFEDGRSKYKIIDLESLCEFTINANKLRKLNSQKLFPKEADCARWRTAPTLKARVLKGNSRLPLIQIRSQSQWTQQSTRHSPRSSHDKRMVKLCEWDQRRNKQMMRTAWTYERKV